MALNKKLADNLFDNMPFELIDDIEVQLDSDLDNKIFSVLHSPIRGLLNENLAFEIEKKIMYNFGIDNQK